MDTAREKRDQPSASAARGHPGRVDWAHHRALRARAVGWGALAGALVVGVYVGTLAVANSLEHLREDVLRLWPWMAPLVVGFSTQVGLFAYARSGLCGGRSTPHARGVVASGGASTASMVACCAHHLTDVLPVVGFAGAATLLATYQSAFLLLGVLSNFVGLVYVLGLATRVDGRIRVEGKSRLYVSTSMASSSLLPLLHMASRRSRSAFPMTDTELRLMAAAAMMGDSSRPKAGYRTPAAMGTPAVL